LQQPQVCNGKGELRPKSERDLAKFEKIVCHELARRDSAAMATTLVAPASTPLTVYVQQMMGALQEVRKLCKENAVPKPAEIQR